MKHTALCDYLNSEKGWPMDLQSLSASCRFASTIIYSTTDLVSTSQQFNSQALTFHQLCTNPLAQNPYDLW